MADTGKKLDAGKPPMDLIDASAMEELARVLDFGARKYAPNNWRKGISSGRLIAAAERHIAAIKRGEMRDRETSLLHAAHAMCELMFLTHFQLAGVDYPDDRWPKAEPANENVELCGRARCPSSLCLPCAKPRGHLFECSCGFVG